jgi:hypothetical protein
MRTRGAPPTAGAAGADHARHVGHHRPAFCSCWQQKIRDAGAVWSRVVSAFLKDLLHHVAYQTVTLFVYFRQIPHVRLRITGTGEASTLLCFFKAQ